MSWAGHATKAQVMMVGMRSKRQGSAGNRTGKAGPAKPATAPVHAYSAIMSWTGH